MAKVKRGMRMAKADTDDIKSMRTFLQIIDEITSPGFQLSDWECDPDDGNYDFYNLLKSICSKSDPDNEIDLFSLAWYFQNKVSHKFWRVLMGFEILLENVCDPDLDYLEYKPELKDCVPRDKAKKIITWALKRK